MHTLTEARSRFISDHPNLILVKLVRLVEGRDEEPSLTIIDSQSVKTVEKRG